ncbi:MAG: ArnT family glycosyltransferase [Acidobacteriota bacterium]
MNAGGERASGVPLARERRWPEEPLWWTAFAVVLAVHLSWQLLNDAPPVWDMAYHQLKGWETLRAWNEGRLFGDLAGLSPSYPPLYYLQEALVLRFWPGTEFLAILSNLAGLFLLSYSTYRLAALHLSPPLAPCAGFLALLFPMVAWVGRESLLDGPLAGWVAAGGYLIVRSQFFQQRRWTFLFGLVCAAGALTKWTFPIYLVLPVLYGTFRSRQRQKSLTNLFLAFLLSLPLLLPYYLPNLADLMARYPTTHQAGWIPWLPYPRHGEPGLNNILGWIYYPRVLASYFLYLPLTLLFLVGAVGSWRRRGDWWEEPALVSPAYLWWWLAGGILFLTFLTPKDPRFALPLAPPLAILLVYLWRNRPLWVITIAGLSLLQFLSVSLPLPWSVKLALWERKGDRDYQSLQREWVLYATHYFDVAGPPRREHWPYREILSSLLPGSRIGFLADLPRFHPQGLRLEAARTGLDVQVVKLGENEEGLAELDSLDFVISKTGYQGVSFITRFNSDVVEGLGQRNWRRLNSWDLPDQSQAVLWGHPPRGKSRLSSPRANSQINKKGGRGRGTGGAIHAWR